MSIEAKKLAVIKSNAAPEVKLKSLEKLNASKDNDENKCNGKKRYYKGDLAEYTGESKEMYGGKFFALKMLEGIHKGKIFWTQHGPNGEKPRGDSERAFEKGVKTPQVGWNEADENKCNKIEPKAELKDIRPKLEGFLRNWFGTAMLGQRGDFEVAKKNVDRLVSDLRAEMEKGSFKSDRDVYDWMSANKTRYANEKKNAMNKVNAMKKKILLSNAAPEVKLKALEKLDSVKNNAQSGVSSTMRGQVKNVILRAESLKSGSKEMISYCDKLISNASSSRSGWEQEDYEKMLNSLTKAMNLLNSALDAAGA